MAPKFKGYPKGAPFPTTPLNILIQQAEERRQQRLAAAAVDPKPTVNLMPMAPKVIAKVNLMMMKPKAKAKQINEAGHEAAWPWLRLLLRAQW